MEQYLIFFGSLLIGGGLGYLAYKDSIKRADKNFERKEKEAEDLIKKAQSHAHEIIKKTQIDEQRFLEKIRKDEERLVSRDIATTEREKTIDIRLEKIEKQKEDIEQRKKILEQEKQALKERTSELDTKLAEIAKISPKEAKEKLFQDLEKEFENDLSVHVNKIVEARKEDAQTRANEYIVEAIQKYASEVANEATSTVVTIPSDDVKGRIIGKEGRNISVFENLTGVDVVVDDTPGSILISGFDLMRRHIAKVALERLIDDGRIHPARIEEIVKKTAEDTNKMLRKLGEESVRSLNLTAIIPAEMYKIIGRLHFRTSYGQNVLKHSQEVAHMAMAIAAEMKLDTQTTKAAAFLHDIGKAVTHEIEGSHAIIGAQILRKFKIPEKIINPVESHHEDVPANSLESRIVAAADAISAARLGARTDSLENYVKRLTELENLATTYTGVEKAYAIAAGREVRVFVTPKKINDLDAAKIAKNITKDIETNMTYPGEIKVNVIREARFEEYAK